MEELNKFEELDKHPLKRISAWGQFMGILTIVLGSISTLIGLFNFIIASISPIVGFFNFIGVIPSVITIIIGYLIFRTGREAKYIVAASDDFKMNNLNELLDKYGKVLLISAIMGIILIALILILLILFLIGVMSMSMSPAM